MKRIEGRARTVRELLNGSKYTIDFYQRDYAWKERQVRELIDDLTGKFLDFYMPGHERRQVENYGQYFLGSIVISHKQGQRFIVDGQQRLTTLTLLLVYLHHLQKDRAEHVEVHSLIYSDKYGNKSFNLDVDERTEVMHSLLTGKPFDTNGHGLSVQNLVARYNNIVDYFPEEVAGKALLHFIDWLQHNVHFVEIEAYSDEDAYTIFETMNDRGLSLSLPDMLKGYVLSNIRYEDDQRAANETWQALIQDIKDLGGDQDDTDFFKDWLRARHAETIRQGKKGAANRDYERIGTEFHRWIRDNKDRLQLIDSDDFIRFVKRDMNFYARQYCAIRTAACVITSGWESIWYNEDRGFTLQTQAILAPLTPDDLPEEVEKKVALVADFLDIWLARRVWNFRTIAYSSVRYTLFQLMKELRDHDVPSLSAYLRAQLDAQRESFTSEPRLRLHNQNYRQIRHILARLTHWVDVQCGLASHFEDLVSRGRGRPFEIEHIWADKYDAFVDYFAHPSDFETERNRLGGLLLLQRGLNQSLGDAPYEAKRDAYASHGPNLLARSLHPLAYQNNPAFARLRTKTGLPFRPYDHFGPEQQAERQELYIRLAEWVWNPSRLDLDGEKPPVPKPILDPEETNTNSADRPLRDEARQHFWEALLSHAKAQSDLHAHTSPSRFSWIGARRHGQGWNYVVLKSETRVELYINALEPTENKAIYDNLFAQCDAIEADFGGELLWQRLDGRQASRISYTVPGGWADESTWPAAIVKAVDAMNRFYAALAPRVMAVREEDCV